MSSASQVYRLGISAPSENALLVSSMIISWGAAVTSAVGGKGVTTPDCSGRARGSGVFVGAVPPQLVSANRAKHATTEQAHKWRKRLSGVRLAVTAECMNG